MLNKPENNIKFGINDDGSPSFEINNDNGLIRGCYYTPTKKMKINDKMVLPKPRLNVFMLMCSKMHVIQDWFKILCAHYETKIISLVSYCKGGDPFFIHPDVHPVEFFDDPFVEDNHDGETFNITGKVKA